MKKLVTLLFVAAGFLATAQVKAQAPKIGYISVQELVIAMPEFKKADTALADYQNALNEQYADMVRDFNRQDSLLSGPDTLKYTKAQLEVRRRELGQLYLKLQGWNQQAQQLYNSKEQEQLQPVYDKARKAIQDVAKENGFTYVFSKEQLIVSPPGDDMMALVKRKLGIR
ncbi:MAG TPA: OmpH family outer membrane protein [Chitinophagaceae bacterium]|nr:OmpH family outer membrane protein [Chitinophagaceae bacterium]